MVLFPNDTLSFYSRGAAVRDGEGIITSYNYTLYKAVRADVQPLGQQGVELLTQGLSDLTANDRVAFLNYDSGIGAPMKAVSTTTGINYEVLNDSPWPGHMALILRPMQMGQVQ
jgi:hypothetical protein